MARLSDAGIPTGISISPIIPGLNDEDIPELLERGKQAGAGEAMATLVRLSGSVETVFLERMGQAFPERLPKIKHRIQEVRGGAMSNNAFFLRQRGDGPYWKMVERLFEVARRKAGFASLEDATVPCTFRRPHMEQATLF
jgi:DNA repair photolyase